MSEIGIRKLKAHASEMVRRVAEEHATYTITRRGRAVAVLAPSGLGTPGEGQCSQEGWHRLLELAGRMSERQGARRSGVKELTAMRR